MPEDTEDKEKSSGGWRMLKDMSNDDEHEVLLGYGALHDMLSDMIESGRLTEADIPDDYHALVETLEELGNCWEWQSSEDESSEDEPTNQ